MPENNFMESLAKSIEEEKTNKKVKKVEESPVYEEKIIEKEIQKNVVEEKPASFNQEKFEKISKEKRNLNPKAIIPLAFLALLCLIGIYFLFFAPKIKMLDFTGKNIGEFTSWATQNKIVKNSIALKHEYSFEYDKDIIISQSIKAGKKIYKDTLMDITLSDGPNPDENVKFPDIKNMNIDEINDWIKTNKLLKTKVVTQYNETVAENSVISYDLKSTNENNFTRGTALNISVSKGKAPAGQVTVEDFTNKNYDDMINWAKNKKVELEKEEGYSDKLQKGYVISQSVKSGTAIKEGEKITVIVSKGKAVKVPNLVGYNSNMLEVWTANKDNNVTVVKKEVYSDKPVGSVLAQSIPANSSVDQGSVLELTVSLYLPILQQNSRAWYGKDYQELIAKVDEFNFKGANISAGNWMGVVDYDDDAYKVAGSIIEYKCLDVNGKELVYAGSEGTNACGRPLPIDAKISMKVSSGNPSQRYKETHKKEEPTPTPTVLPSVMKPTLENLDTNNKAIIKTTPNAKVTITSIDNSSTILLEQNADNNGYVSIDISNLPEYVSVRAELDGYKSEENGISLKPQTQQSNN